MGERAFQLAQMEFDRPLATFRFAAMLEQLTRKPGAISEIERAAIAAAAKREKV
jgi:hypothetical protein